MAHYDFLIAGAGFAGAVCAEQLASRAGKTCLVVDRRSHIAGNAYDFYDSAGVLLHKYGPHYFRTNAQKIIDYLSRFTDWREVEYKILSWADGRYWQFPINLNTFEQWLGRPSSTEEMQAYLAQWRAGYESPQNSEEFILSRVGPLFYEKFFRHYTAKQWGMEAKELDASVCARIPIRTNRDDRFVSERFQALPTKGYTYLFEQILNHPLITVQLDTEFRDVAKQVTWDHLIYTGPIDDYFDYCFGRLPYRSLRFEPEIIDKEFFQPVVQVNYPNDYDFTRIVEIKHVTGQILPQTTIIREYPKACDSESEPYYPIPSPSARAAYSQYAELAERLSHVTFLGRLANYRYFNMDHVIALALSKADELVKRQGN